MKENIKKVNKILSKGGWKNPNSLFGIKKSNYTILILYVNGKVVKGKWFGDKSYVTSNMKSNRIVAWKEYAQRKTVLEIIKRIFKLLI